MSRWRFRIVYLILIPAIAVAAGILGYYSWLTATQFARLGEQTIAQSTLLIVSDKVDRIEQQLIDADNAVFELVDPAHPERLEEEWPPVAQSISPSVQAVLLLDDTGNVLAYAHEGTAEERRELLKVFLDRIVPDLELERQRVGRLKHLHQSYGGESYLVSYEARISELTTTKVPLTIRDSTSMVLVRMCTSSPRKPPCRPS